MVALIALIFAGLAGILAVSTTASPLLGLIVFGALFLLLSGGGLAFISTISLPNVVVILIVFIIIFKLIGGKK